MLAIGELLKERQRAVKCKDFDLVRNIDVMMEDRVFDATDMRMEINKHQPDVGWGHRR